MQSQKKGVQREGGSWGESLWQERAAMGSKQLPFVFLLLINSQMRAARRLSTSNGDFFGFGAENFIIFNGARGGGGVVNFFSSAA